MKKPRRPPDQSKFSSLEFEEINRILGQCIGTDPDHMHWDDLLHRQPPKGLSHDQWWFGLKMLRPTKLIPLRDSEGKRFSYTKLDQIEEAQHLIDSRASGRIGVPDRDLNPQFRDRYYVSSLIEEAITSSQLEGAVTTRKKAKEMIRSGRSPRDKSEQMILNNYRTMRQVESVKGQALTPEVVLELQRAITEGTLDDPATAGSLRTTDDVHVVDALSGEIAHTPPPAAELKNRLKQMCDFANAKSPKEFVHPVIRSIILHFWLAYDHPFVDGNGRTARVLFYWSMLRHDYWLFEFLSISSIIKRGPSKYSRAFLLTETDENDLTYFILYHLHVIDQSIKKLDEYILRKTREMQDIESRLGGLDGFNHRQKALLSHALRHPYQNYTFGSHSTSHNVVHQTARTDILGLVELGLLVEHRVGRQRYFSPVPNIEERLRGLDAAQDFGAKR